MRTMDASINNNSNNNNIWEELYRISAWYAEIIETRLFLRFYTANTIDKYFTLMLICLFIAYYAMMVR